MVQSDVSFWAAMARLMKYGTGGSRLGSIWLTRNYF